MSSPRPLRFAELVEANRAAPGMVGCGARAYPRERGERRFRGGVWYWVGGRSSLLRRRGRCVDPPGPAIGAGGAAGPQGEVAGRRWLGGQQLLVTEHEYAAIEEFADLDAAVDVSAVIQQSPPVVIEMSPPLLP